MDLCGINITCPSTDYITANMSSTSIVVTVNAEAIVRAQNNLKLKKIINQSLTTIDGQIPLWLYRMKYGHQSAEKVSGSELIYTLPSFASEHNLKVFLLGGKKESNKLSIKNLRNRNSKLTIDGYSPEYHPYPFPESVNRQIFEHISHFKPDILFVGFGMGKQEFWAYDNLDKLTKLNVKLIVGCGGSFEFASGKIKRAPQFIQNIGMEGVWRLLNEFKWFRIKRLFISTKIFYYYLKSN